MSNIGVTYNNPGNLTVNGPNSFLYAGQTGVYPSPNGFYYATFPDPQTGSAALNTYVQNNIGTDPNTSESTLGQALAYFLNGSQNGIQNTAANPNAVGYANGVAAATGIGLNTPFTSQDVNNPSLINSISAAIAQQEGTSSVYSNGGAASAANSVGSTNIFTEAYGGLMNFINANPSATGYGTDSSVLQSGLGNNLTQMYNNALGVFGVGSGSAGNISANTAAGQVSATSAGSASTGAGGSTGLFTGLTNWLTAQEKGFEGGIQPFLVRGGFGLVGAVLLIVGIVFLAASNKTVVQTVKTGAALLT